MARLQWPAWMPKPLQSGFSMQPEDRRTASSTAGTSFQKGFDGDICVAEVSLTLNRLQAAWLEQFERDAARQGTVWFDFPIWYAGQVHWERCRFKTRPKLSLGGGSLHSSFSFSLYVWRRTELMPDCMVQVFACFPPCFFVEFTDGLQVFLWKLTSITTANVNSALAEIYED